MCELCFMTSWNYIIFCYSNFKSLSIMTFIMSKCTCITFTVGEMWFVIAGLILLIVAVGMRLFRSQIYNIMIVHLTSQWYQEVLALLSSKSKLLDVGIGTGQALMKNDAIIIQKKLKIDGVDYDSDYVKECQLHIDRKRLQKYVTVCHQSILDYQGGPYDAIYFSASLMILPNPVEALNHVKKMLASNGKIIVTQTIETKRSTLIEFGKPLLKYLTTIDFGTVTYEDDLFNAFKEANLKIKLNKSISGTSLRNSTSFRLFVLESI